MEEIEVYFKKVNTWKYLSEILLSNNKNFFYYYNDSKNNRGLIKYKHSIKEDPYINYIFTWVE